MNLYLIAACRRYCAVGLGLFFCGCEDGPKSVYSVPEEHVVDRQNGPIALPPTWVPSGEHTFDDADREEVDFDRFGCSELQRTEQLARMRRQPIRLNHSLAGVAFWSETKGALALTEQLGDPSNAKLCSPTMTEETESIWGHDRSIVVRIDPVSETVSSVRVSASYVGTATATYVRADKPPISVELGPGRFVRINGEDLTAYASREVAPAQNLSWLNHRNVSQVYVALRSTYWPDAHHSDDFDCVAARRCFVLYEQPQTQEPQASIWVFPSLGLEVSFEPNGRVREILVSPVRRVRFEESAEMSMGGYSAASALPRLTSASEAGCELALTEGLTWGDVKDRCLSSEEPQASRRASYYREPGLDTSKVRFGVFELGFMRSSMSTPHTGMIEPAEEDLLYSIGFLAGEEVAVVEHVPFFVASQFASLTNQYLRGTLAPTSTIEEHPFFNYQLDVPLFPLSPGPIIALFDPSDGRNWVAKLIDKIQNEYDELSPAQQAMVDRSALEDVNFAKLFVESVLILFTHANYLDPNLGLSDFRLSANGDLLVGRAHYRTQMPDQSWVPLRFEMIYSMNTHRILWASFEALQNELDRLLDAANQLSSQPFAYYSAHHMINAFGSVFANGSSNMIRVIGYHPASKQVQIEVQEPATGRLKSLWVPGVPRNRGGGYFAQVGPEQWDFVAADSISLLGRDVSLFLYLDQDGAISRSVMPNFKGVHILCAPVGHDALLIQLGEDVLRVIERWAEGVPVEAYAGCDFIFNYSENGKQLKSVASLSFGAAVEVVAGLATTAIRWRSRPRRNDGNGY